MPEEITGSSQAQNDGLGEPARWRKRPVAARPLASGFFLCVSALPTFKVITSCVDFSLTPPVVLPLSCGPGELERCAVLENGFDHGLHGFHGWIGDEGWRLDPRVPAPFFIRVIRAIRGPSGTTGWTRHRSQKPF